MTHGTEELLDRAAALWVTSRAAHREGQLAVGRLLHEYVLAGLTAGDGLSKTNRHAAGAHREGLVRTAAAALRTTRDKVNELVKVARLVDLLGGGDPGTLPWGVLRTFRLLVRRCHLRRGEDARGPHGIGRPHTNRERWVVVEGYEASGPALFAEARAADWHDYAAARRCVHALLGDRVPRHAATGAPRYDTATKSAAAALVADSGSAQKDTGRLLMSDPRDVADHLARLVRLHPRRAELEALLRAALFPAPAPLVAV